MRIVMLIIASFILSLAAAQAPAGAVKPGTTQKVGIWNITAGKQPVLKRTAIGDEFLATEADQGYIYALVPVSVQNSTRKTDSWLLVSWKLRDDKGNVYETDTEAGFYLPQRQQLDLTNVPPGATRSGYLVFQVSRSAKTLWLTVEAGFAGSKSWQLR